ncbi:calreticulin [Cimex lectularius]|uniref:Calreticulin n=1 Tax=Cimex lectularius TaxID=79782 RepID=A0A8I6RFQ3_CIMLE|nr:calreticulin [Cimex lectularius]
MRALLLLTLFSVAFAELYFQDKFSDASWEERWVYSEHSGKEFGKFTWTAGKLFNDAEKDKGLQTSQDARFYAISTKFPSFTNKGKTLVVQFRVKHEQNIDCGGGYVKLFDCSLDQKNLHGESPYEVMFGPDICGSTKKVHVIFSYKGRNVLVNKDIRCKDDVFSHFYTLVVKPDNTYEVLIDNEKVESGNLEDDFDFLPPKMIKDPEAKKPEDWEDNPTIDDPTDSKPEDWDKPATIPDPEANKPEDWDTEMDGEWEPPQIDNPEFKGEWKPKQIDNPNYKGPWIHPEIENPEYSPDNELYVRKELCSVGFDLWQVKSGTVFGNLLITDDVELAKKEAEVVKEMMAGEEKMKTAQENEAKEKDMEEAGKDKKKTEDEDDEDEDEDEDSAPKTEDHDEL